MTESAQSFAPHRLGRRFLRFLLYFMLVLVALYYLMPLFVMVTTSLKELSEIRSGNLMYLPQKVVFDAWETAWSSACTGVICNGLKPYFWISIKMTVLSVLIATALGAFNGYVLAQWRFKYADTIFTLMLFGCFIPFQIVLLPMARVLGFLGLAGSVSGLVLVHVIYGISFSTLFFRNFYVTVHPELVKAAKVDGAGFFRVFFSIFLPISPPIIVVTLIWLFTNIWNDFLFGVSFGQSGIQPVTVALNNIVNSTTGVKEYNVDMAAAIITGLPTLFVYIVAGRYFLRGLTAGSVKG